MRTTEESEGGARPPDFPQATPACEAAFSPKRILVACGESSNDGGRGPRWAVAHTPRGVEEKQQQGRRGPGFGGIEPVFGVGPFTGRPCGRAVYRRSVAKSSNNGGRAPGLGGIGSVRGGEPQHQRRRGVRLRLPRSECAAVRGGRRGGDSRWRPGGARQATAAHGARGFQPPRCEALHKRAGQRFGHSTSSLRTSHIVRTRREGQPRQHPHDVWVDTPPPAGPAPHAKSDTKVQSGRVKAAPADCSSA
ncbi:hypothetical protein CLV63_12835 [Murinocardiopsis flavida]|uniref:Uncharacterized protein n=1 Tax=Murinocardiopsis flavida TaxID=645275 RepID=A0A2P8CVG2_9ACTN|nr:hypothetical protein CLV63_12835 [Murinocardiopsis flavida]